ncbi:MAG: hypothetical protein HY785_23140 [Oscillatoriophycideae cyanobacterium NC_groundwater_1537_Pr4_S-0.65um_50_18]|nr:hypothetical protein [Oscillatoriophycideae cyanobacterium NC_groundwater_1537_Pr4_S-0.65um_50_18]
MNVDKVVAAIESISVAPLEQGRQSIKGQFWDAMEFPSLDAEEKQLLAVLSYVDWLLDHATSEVHWNLAAQSPIVRMYLAMLWRSGSLGWVMENLAAYNDEHPGEFGRFLDQCKQLKSTVLTAHYWAE